MRRASLQLPVSTVTEPVRVCSFVHRTSGPVPVRGPHCGLGRSYDRAHSSSWSDGNVTYTWKWPAIFRHSGDSTSFIIMLIAFVPSDTCSSSLKTKLKQLTEILRDISACLWYAVECSSGLMLVGLRGEVTWTECNFGRVCWQACVLAPGPVTFLWLNLTRQSWSRRSSCVIMKLVRHL
jgi:hypothetical protein